MKQNFFVICDTQMIKASLCESMKPWRIQVFLKVKQGANLLATECTCHWYTNNKQPCAEHKHHASSCVRCILYVLDDCWLKPREISTQQCDWAYAVLSWGVLIGGLSAQQRSFGGWNSCMSQKCLCLMIDYNYGLLCESWLSWVGELTRLAEA